jgi:N-acetylglucosamine kinase-like BadF-type ATPase
MMGEGAGASELIHRTMQIIGYAWSKRGAETALADAFIKYAGAKDLEDLIRGYTVFEYPVGADAAPIVFRVAAEGDLVARELIHWAGVENGEMANAVIRQLGFEDLEFDVVLAGSMFEGGSMMIDPMRETISKCAPGARLVRLSVPPVLGAVILGMEAAGVKASPSIRKTIAKSIPSIRNISVR